MFLFVYVILSNAESVLNVKISTICLPELAPTWVTTDGKHLQVIPREMSLVMSSAVTALVGKELRYGYETAGEE